MRFLERAIRRGVSNAVGKAIGNAVTQAVEPKASELVNRAANTLQGERQAPSSSGTLEGAVGNLERVMQDYGTQAAKNMKLCPKCNEPTTADRKFCPHCGAQLPAQTVAEGAVCTCCGKQNTIGTKFCQECGTKLPAALAEEQARAEADAEVMSQWDRYLSHYPKWSCGGSEFNIEFYDPGVVCFTAFFAGNHSAAQRAVAEYRQLLFNNGFREAGEYPCIEQLYKMENGVCYHVDTGMCFEGSPDSPQIAFDQSEPCGGFYYEKPQPKRKASFMDLFK